MSSLTDYERRQLREIRAWQGESPGWGSRLLAKPGGKLATAVQAVIPLEALRAALDGVNKVAEKLSDEKAILARAELQSIEQLRTTGLDICDDLMRTEQRRATMIAGAGGAAFGIAGAVGMVADVPTLIALALRTIHRVALCYGEDLRDVDRRRMAIGVFALASANSLEEKQSAVAALRDYHPERFEEAAWRDGVERAAERELAKEAAVFSIQNLARRLGINIGKRKVAGVVPVLGAVIGGSVNAWYLWDVAQVSRYVFQERWLAERHSPAALTKATVALAKP